MAAFQVVDQGQAVLPEGECAVRLEIGPRVRDAGRGRDGAAGKGSRCRARRPAGTGKVLRILQMINILQSGEYFTADELAKKMGISRRTAFRDVETLIRFGVPCRFDPIRRGYCINGCHYLPQTNLDLGEALGLYIAAVKMVNSKAFPFAAEAGHAVDKVVELLPADVRTMCMRLANVVAVRWPAMVDAQVPRQVFQVLQEAAGGSCKVHIRYDSQADKRGINTVVHPYMLALLNRMWCVVGYSEASRQIQSFHLDRILSVDALYETFTRPADFSLDDYLGQAWSVVREGRIWPVRLRFTAGVAADVVKTVWHKTQQTLRLPDGSLRFEVQVDGLTEISRWILGFGDQVVVEKPVELRDRVQAIARRIANQYVG